MVIIRFGSDADDTCMQMDETLASVADKMKNFAVIYLVDIAEVPDFNAMYELYDPCTVMFFFRNRVRDVLPASLRLSSKVKITHAPTLLLRVPRNPAYDRAVGSRFAI